MRLAIEVDEATMPHGFILSESALYAFKCQEVFPDLISFAAAIPGHLRSLFLIPIRLEMEPKVASSIVASVAARRYADGAVPTGNTEEADLFGAKTFVNDDNSPTIPSSEPGSIFEVNDADDMTHHQEYNYDENIQDKSDTSFMSDVDMTQYQKYPYRTDEKPVRHSSTIPVMRFALLRTALKEEVLDSHTPDKIQQNAENCSVRLTSYDKPKRTFTFSADCGNGAKVVRASMSELDEVAMTCSCNFWRYNGPDFNAQQNKFLLGNPQGTASPPNVRDPERQYWLCKHAYAVLKRLSEFVQNTVDENWGLDDSEMMDLIDQNWDKMEEEAKVPLAQAQEDDPEVLTDWDVESDGQQEPESQQTQVDLDDFEPESQQVQVDLSDLEPDAQQQAQIEYGQGQLDAQEAEAVQAQEAEAEEEEQTPPPKGRPKK